MNTPLILLRHRRLRADLTLLAVAVVWGSAFVVQRVAALHMGPLLFNGVRFLLGALTLSAATWGRWRAMSRLEWQGGTLAGLVLLAAVTLQQIGLQSTTAGKAGFITGLYVVLVPLFLALQALPALQALLRSLGKGVGPAPAPVEGVRGCRQRLHGAAGSAPLLAVAGLFLLSTGGSTPSEGQLTLAPGDGLELISAVLWALHVILIGRLAGRTNGLRLALVQYLACGSLSTALGLAFELHTLGGLATAWWAVVYGGVLSVGVGYTLQVIGQKATPAADAAIILSMEAAFAALFGWLLLGETLTVRQLLGCGLMLAGMLLAQASALRRAEPHRPPHTNSSVVTTYKETT